MKDVLQPLLMSKTDFDIHYVAKLARLELTEDEEETFGRQVGKVIDNIEQLQQLDVTNVEPTAHPVPLTNVTRPDELRKSLTNDEALMNAPAKGNGLFMVPKIVE
ncbi:MAG: Asp-tRNA(Asn)/Glu-tRNA(Gln) amidotransferase subunit GatC [Verrucomicrobiae bacterium]|nr:Asp-tRNA(Asn)/Glu-tRNA(Gln) amidotransferase subunit GatC [Verrucomicrobiae bacterium]